MATRIGEAAVQAAADQRLEHHFRRHHGRRWTEESQHGGSRSFEQHKCGHQYQYQGENGERVAQRYEPRHEPRMSGEVRCSLSADPLVHLAGTTVRVAGSEHQHDKASHAH